MEPSAKSLARTYTDRVYSDPWGRVEDYHRVMEYSTENPFEGRTLVGNALDLPEWRVDGWLKDQKPNPVRGIETAEEFGWLNPDPESEIAAALVSLAAHVQAGGSIYDNYYPSVYTNESVSEAVLEQVFRDVGVDVTYQHVDSEQPTVVVASENGSVLGRCLACMGVSRTSDPDENDLTDVLNEVPDPVRQEYHRISRLYQDSDEG